MSNADARYMDRALFLAERGLGRTWPNPMVGAVLVKHGTIVGEGFHRRYGGPHAEAIALGRAGSDALGATLYVNLEPCSHQGKTPPCAEAVIKAGIRRVVAAMQDPNPKVAGRGFKMLRRAGIRVDTGLRKTQAMVLNRVFFKQMVTGLPYVVCKAAVSMDGKIACPTGVSKWITSPHARRYAHRLRGLADAIIVGAETVFQDDPELTVRHAPLRRPSPPMRIILAGHRLLPQTAKLFRIRDGSRTIIAHGDRLPGFRVLPANVEKWYLPVGFDRRLDIESLLRRLTLEGASFVLVEGGGEVHASFLGLGAHSGKMLVDEIQFIMAPVILGGKDAPGPVGGPGVSAPDQGVALRNVDIRSLGKDFLVRGTPVIQRPRGSGNGGKKCSQV